MEVTGAYTIRALLVVYIAFCLSLYPASSYLFFILHYIIVHLASSAVIVHHYWMLRYYLDYYSIFSM